MSDQSRTLIFEQVVPTSPELVYRAFTNSGVLRRWLADVATVSPRVNGRFYLAWSDNNYTAGHYTRLEENREVGFTWFGRDDPGKTVVNVSIIPENDQTKIVIKHSHIGVGEGWQETVAAFKKHWPASLENLASVLTTGEDLRLSRRPVLGFSISNINADVAAKLNLPITQGIRVEEIVKGKGAEAAGLQGDDVIVRLAGKEITDWNSLFHAVDTCQAGDTVEVEFYRGSDKHKVDVTFARRPIPKMPETAVLLAEKVQTILMDHEAELENFFAEVTEQEASQKPAPQAWSAIETLAHLTLAEGWMHVWIEGLIGDHVAWYDHFSGNVQERITAALAVYPTPFALLDELKRRHAETIALIRNLPDRFMARKDSYWRMVYFLMSDLENHHPAHMAQMREAIDQVRLQTH